MDQSKQKQNGSHLYSLEESPDVTSDESLEENKSDDSESEHKNAERKNRPTYKSTDINDILNRILLHMKHVEYQPSDNKWNHRFTSNDNCDDIEKAENTIHYPELCSDNEITQKSEEMTASVVHAVQTTSEPITLSAKPTTPTKPTKPKIIS